VIFRRLYKPFFEELRRMGDVEGQNLIVERYSGEGQPEGFPISPARSPAATRI
jgi:hypothetical protein